MKKIILAAFLVSSLSSYAQLGGLINKVKGVGKGGKLELYEEEKINLEVVTKYAGQLMFSNDDFERELPESKYIKSYTLGDNLALRAWLPNSPVNMMMLQLQESGVKAKEINATRDSFDGQSRVMLFMYLDGVKISNTSYAWDNEQKPLLTVPSVRADFHDGTDKNYFGKSLYKDLLQKQDMLTPGKHKLKIEVVPRKTFGLGADFNFKPIAVGEIDLIVPAQLKLNESDCFPKKAISDPKLEAEAMRAMKKFYKNGAPNAFKVILTQHDMKIVRQEYTGVILRKSFNATIVFKKGDEVWYDWYTFHKEYDGSKYEEAIVYANADISTLDEGKRVNKECLKFLK